MKTLTPLTGIISKTSVCRGRKNPTWVPLASINPGDVIMGWDTASRSHKWVTVINVKSLDTSGCNTSLHILRDLVPPYTLMVGGGEQQRGMFIINNTPTEAALWSLRGTDAETYMPLSSKDLASISDPDEEVAKPTRMAFEHNLISDMNEPMTQILVSGTDFIITRLNGFISILGDAS